MIVHPIGMMRANAAASGYLDDFSGYSEGDDPSTDNPTNYTAVAGSVAGVPYVNATLDELTWHPTNVAANGTTWKYTGSILSDDQFVEAVIGSQLGHPDQYSPWINLYVRYIDDNNFVILQINSNKLATMSKRVAGTWTYNYGGTVQTVLTEDAVVKIEVVGDTVTSYFNGVSKNTITDAALGPGGALESGSTAIQFRRSSAIAPGYLAPISLKSLEFGSA